MNITLTHPFIHTCHDINELLNDVNDLNTFCRRLEKQSKLFPNQQDPLVYKGDGFELLVEALIKLSPIDKRLAIAEYQVNPANEDNGVDGFGVGLNGNPSTVQAKYRTNATQLLTANKDHLSNFAFSSQNKFKVPVDDTNNMLIITTAKGLHHFTDGEMFEGKVTCIGREELKNLIDNNMLFWNSFRQLINEKLLK